MTRLVDIDASEWHSGKPVSISCKLPKRCGFEVQIIMKRPRKPPHSVKFIHDYPAEGQPQYRAGDVEALADSFARKLVINGYAESLEQPKKPKSGRGSAAAPRKKRIKSVIRKVR